MLLTSVIKNLVKRPRHASVPPARHGGLVQQAVAARESGDVNRALDIVRGILSQDPDHGDAHYLAGLWHAQQGAFAQALPHLQRAAVLMPSAPHVQLALGNVYKAGEQGEPAERCYRQVIALAPDDASGHYSLALVLRATRRAEQALHHLRLACAREPYIEGARTELVLMLVALKRRDEALQAARAATRESDRSGNVWACLALAHRQLCQLDEAREAYERAVALGIPDAELQTHMGVLLHDLGEVHASRRAYEAALAIRPGYELARFHLALTDLALHRFETGWDGYELRLISEDRSCPTFRFPSWRGEPLAGKSVLVHGEQGLGDEIMFASCLREVAQLASRCLVSCSPRLEGLFRRSFPGVELLDASSCASLPTGSVDFEVAAGSLPRHMRRSVADFPAHRGYLQADPGRVAYWKTQLAELGPGMKVGVSWRGGTADTRAALRSLPLEQWADIFEISGVQFISLQYGEVPPSLEANGRRVVHWQAAIEDYDETAALVSALDLTISVCTAVIHLAGALGRPVWVMAPASPEWRYGYAGRRMPWYPSAVVYRQPRPGVWRPVVEDVARDLRATARAA